MNYENLKLPNERFLSLLMQAQEGDAVSQFYLGNCFAQGLGIQQNWPEAAHWYRCAADKGHTGAINNLGYLLEEGLGVEQNPTAARTYYERAAKAGDTAGINNVGVLLAQSRAEGDLHQANSYFRTAMEQNCPVARVNLSRCFFKGIGCKKDKEHAYQELCAAAETECLPALTAVGMYPEREPQDPWQKDALHKAASLGDPGACINLGCYLFEESKCLANEAKLQKEMAARDLFWQAAMVKETDSLYHLPYRLYLGEGEDIRWLRLLPWIENTCSEAAQQALQNLGGFYNQTEDPHIDLTLSHAFGEWSERVSQEEQKKPIFTYKMNGHMLNLIGERYAKLGDWDKATAYFQEAHDGHNDPLAALNLFYSWVTGNIPKFSYHWAIRLIKHSERCESLVLLGILEDQRGQTYQGAEFYRKAALRGSIAGQLLWAWELLKTERTQALRLLSRAASWNGPNCNRNAFGTLLPETTDGDSQEEAIHVAPWFRKMTEDAAELSHKLLIQLRETEEISDESLSQAVEDFKTAYCRNICPDSPPQSVRDILKEYDVR